VTRTPCREEALSEAKVWPEAIEKRDWLCTLKELKSTFYVMQVPKAEIGGILLVWHGALQIQLIGVG
jgi:hypothetical protein